MNQSFENQPLLLGSTGLSNLQFSRFLRLQKQADKRLAKPQDWQSNHLTCKIVCELKWCRGFGSF